MPNQSQRERLRAAQIADQRARRWRRIAGVGAAILALVMVAVFVVVLMPQQQSTAAKPGDLTPPNAAVTNDGIVVNPGQGNADAPLVALYFDYQCGGCLTFERTFGTALAFLAESGEIRLENRTRVFLDRGNTEGLSHKAAVGAACADLSGRYSDYHQAVFAAADQGPYTDTLLRETIPTQIGITGEKLSVFQQCFDDRATLTWVTTVEEAAQKAGVNSTPTMTVNGNVVPIEDLTGKTGDDIVQIITAAAA